MVSAGQVARAADVAVQACRVSRTVSQSIPDQVDTVVAFDAEKFDNDDMHDVTTNNSRITINHAGFYEVGFHGRFQSAADYRAVLASINLNGNSIGQILIPGTTISLPQRVSISTMSKFEVGDFLEVTVYQDNTANVSRTLDMSPDYSPEFWAARIGS